MIKVLYTVVAASVAGPVALCFTIAAAAQTRTTRDTATAYGARLDNKGETTGLNQNRVNNRINSRLDTRLSLRIERYRPDSTTDPTAAFTTKMTDNARIGTATTVPHPSSLGDEPSAPGLSGSTPPTGTMDDDASRPR